MPPAIESPNAERPATRHPPARGSRSRGPLPGVHAAAPFLALLALLGVLLIGGFQPRQIAGTDAYFLEVKTEIEAMPYRIGRWIGQDAEVQEAATMLLRPNKILQRRYVDPVTQQAVSVLVVHCGDARDMNGHYPPVCYPAHGWLMQRRAQASVPVGRSLLPAMRYEFTRPEEVGGSLNRDGMVVANLFVLPGLGGEVVLDMSAVERVARSAERSGLGAAQVQVITPASMPDDERDEVHRAFFSALEPVIRTIRAGVDHAG
ncbi:MAG: exosortase-associated EpsI family protein [Phycisphaerales bacterium]|nr:MAG: exosortase-associated EpsI family protein [Phycisphaerales bacterium]